MQFRNRHLIQMRVSFTKFKIFTIDIIIIKLPYKMPHSGVNSGRLKLGNHVVKSSLAVSLSDIKILVKLSFVCFFFFMNY